MTDATIAEWRHRSGYALAGGGGSAADRKIVQLVDEVLTLRDALSWCSGAPAFNEGGEARAGWIKLCAPLLDRR